MQIKLKGRGKTSRFGSEHFKGQMKVKFPLCFFLTEHYTMKVYWGPHSFIHSFIIVIQPKEEAR
jgi:hypothetical protein